MCQIETSEPFSIRSIGTAIGLHVAVTCEAWASRNRPVAFPTERAPRWAVEDHILVTFVEHLTDHAPIAFRGRTHYVAREL